MFFEARVDGTKALERAARGKRSNAGKLRLFPHVTLWLCRSIQRQNDTTYCTVDTLYDVGKKENDGRFVRQRAFYRDIHRQRRTIRQRLKPTRRAMDITGCFYNMRIL